MIFPDDEPSSGSIAYTRMYRSVEGSIEISYPSPLVLYRVDAVSDITSCTTNGNCVGATSTPLLGEKFRTFSSSKCVT